MVAEAVAGAQRESVAPLVVFRDVLQVVVDVEDVDAGDEVAAEEIGVGDRQVDRALQLRDDAVDAGVDAGAEKILLAQPDIGQRADIGRVAAAEGQLAGRLLVDIGGHDRAVRRRARRVGRLRTLLK